MGVVTEVAKKIEKCFPYTSNNGVSREETIRRAMKVYYTLKEESMLRDQLAEKTGIARTTVFRILTHLEQNGLVKKQAVIVGSRRQRKSKRGRRSVAWYVPTI